MISADEMEWSRQLFGGSDLGDARRTRRLVDVAARMASQMGRSLAKSCGGGQAALLGGYQLMRNGAVDPEGNPRRRLRKCSTTSRMQSGMAFWRIRYHFLMR